MVGEKLRELLNAFALELARAGADAESLVTECRAQTTTDMLTDFEREFEIPDPCAPELEDTVAKRRAVVHTKETYRGSLNKAYYVNLAKSLGYTDDDDNSDDVSVRQFTPAWAGVMRAGDPCGDQWVIFHWYLQIPWRWQAVTAPGRGFTSGFSRGFNSYWVNNAATAINVIGDTLRCFIERYAPAHTKVEIVYIGPGFTRGFSSGFRAMPTIYNWTDGGFRRNAFSEGFSQPKPVSNEYYTGGFSQGFRSKGFNVHRGGGFRRRGFSNGFSRPM